MSEEGRQASESINSNLSGGSKPVSIRITVPEFSHSCLMEMFDFEPWMNPQTLTYTFVLFRCPHWQHHSWCISWVYGSYLCSQGISEEVELGKKPWNKAQITPPLFTTLAVFQVSAPCGPGVFNYQRRNNNTCLVALQGLNVITNVCVHACSVVFNALWFYKLSPSGLLCPWNFPGKNTGVGTSRVYLLQGIFLTQGSNTRLLCLLLGRQILYHWAILQGLNVITNVECSK